MKKATSCPLKMSLTKITVPLRNLGACVSNSYIGRRFVSKGVLRIRPRPIKTAEGDVRMQKKKTPLLSESQLYDAIPNANLYEPELTESIEDIILNDPDYFKVRDFVTTKRLFDARVHFGHAVGCRNPHMVPYLFGSRVGTDIIDLEQTKSLMQDALNFLAHVVYRGGLILFITKSKQNMFIVEKAARDAGEYSHCRYWKGGIMTNSEKIFKGTVRLPDVMIFLNTMNSVMEQHVAVVESSKSLVPTIGVVDTNCDPRLISYPIPGNDDTPQSIQLYCDLFRDTILRAKEYSKRDNVSDDKDDTADVNLAGKASVGSPTS